MAAEGGAKELEAKTEESKEDSVPDKSEHGTRYLFTALIAISFLCMVTSVFFL